MALESSNMNKEDTYKLLISMDGTCSISSRSKMLFRFANLKDLHRTASLNERNQRSICINLHKCNLLHLVHNIWTKNVVIFCNPRRSSFNCFFERNKRSMCSPLDYIFKCGTCAICRSGTPCNMDVSVMVEFLVIMFSFNREKSWRIFPLNCRHW